MRLKPNIREAEIGDAAEMLRYLTGIYGESLTVLLSHAGLPSLDEERSYIAKLTRLPNSLVLVAEHERQIVGVLDFHGRTHPQMSHSGALGISVCRDCRGMGVGRALLTALVGWIETERRVWRAELEVFANNPRAIGLYRAMGFVVEGTKEKAVRVDADYVDLLLMARIWPHVNGRGHN